MRTLLLSILLCLPLLGDNVPRMIFSVGGGGETSGGDIGEPAGPTCTNVANMFVLASNGTTTLGLNTAKDFTAQQFTAADSYDACSLDVYLSKVGSPAYNIAWSIYSNNNAGGTNVPGTKIGSSASLAATSVTDTELLYNLSISATNLTSGSVYWIVAECDGVGDALNCVKWHRASSTLSNSIMESGTGSSWTLVSGTRVSKYTIYSQ
jgi:hypothetical protein